MRSSPDFPGLRRLAGALAIVALSVSCGTKEKPGASPAAPAGKSAAANADGTSDTAPSIRDTPETGRPPFFGLREARDAAVDDRGRVWVTDFGHAAIRIFTGDGGFLGGWGGRGDGRYQLKDPCGIAIRGNDVYIADTWNGRVLHYSLAGAWEGKAPGDFYGPRGIAVAPDGRIWVADTGNQRVVSYDRDLTNPKFYGAKDGNGPSPIVSPIGIAAGPSGRIYVADTANRRIQVLEPDGAFESHFDFPSWASNSEPYLDVDEGENIYATDPAGQAVVKLDRNGKELQRWTQDDAGRKFARPTGIALDQKNGVLYVVNTDIDTVGTLKLTK